MLLKLVLEVQNAVGRFLDVWIGRNESERAIERLRVDHGWECVQHEPVEAQVGRLDDEALDEATAEATRSSFRRW